MDCVDLDALEHQAKAQMSLASYAFCACGADDEISLAENISAWRNLRLRPRVLRDVTAIDTSVSILGKTMPAPIMVALMSAHVCEIAVWAGYYDLTALQLNKHTGYFEFAFENYTALGYGDALPVDGNRLIGPITSLNGVLLIGWSVAVIFEVMRMAELRFGRHRKASN